MDYQDESDDASGKINSDELEDADSKKDDASDNT